MALSTPNLKLSGLPSWLPPLVTLVAIGLGILGLIFIFTIIADTLSQATDPVDADLTSFEEVRVGDFERVKQRLELDFSMMTPTTAEDEEEVEETTPEIEGEEETEVVEEDVAVEENLPEEEE